MPKLIFITGGSASGKSHLSKQLMEVFGKRAVLLTQDSFYKSNGSPDDNFDIPQAFNFDEMKRVFEEFKTGKSVDIPVYDFKIHDVVGSETIESKEYIIFEGLFTLYDQDLANMADLKIFVDTPSDIRLSRRITRDISTRGRVLETIIERWNKDVQPSYQTYISNKKRKADIIVPWSSINRKSIKALLIAITHLGMTEEELMNHKH